MNTVSAQTTDPANVNTPLLTKAMDLYNAHKYKESIPEFSKVIKEDEKNGQAYFYRGMAKMHEKQNGFCKDLEESMKLGYSTSADIYYYGCDTHSK
jgi:hypothetical protein